MSCPVTLDPYTDENYPVSLQCGHTISVVAARQVLGTASVVPHHGDRRLFKCPVCRSEWDLLPGHHFPKNYALLEVLQGQAATPPAVPAPAPAAAPAPPAPAAAAVAPDDTTQDIPTEIFLACDVSGSMGACVNKNLGLTRLDLVKYNVEMLLRYVATCQPPMRVSIVSFSCDTQVVVNREFVTPDSLDGLIARLATLQPMYTTNLLGAVYRLLEMMPEEPGKRVRNIGVVLTDGQPTNRDGFQLPDDPSSYQLALETFPTSYHSFSMMGYGHKLSHRIMLETARKGQGACTFGSDESMISNVFIRWLAWALAKERALPASLRLGSGDGRDFEVAAEQRLRANFCDALEKSLRLRDMKPMRDFLETPVVLRMLDKRLIEECGPEGEIGMAFRPDKFRTWGQAYLHATLRGHELGHAWNFKDKPLDSYITPDCQSIVESLDRIFEMMPAPTPSKVATESIAYRGGMSQVFNNSNSTCWLPDSPITLADGSVCLIQNLRPGMEVVSYNPETRSTSTSQVVWMVRQPCTQSFTRAVEVGESSGERYSTLLTANHPILDFSTRPSPMYRHAKEIGCVEDSCCSHVYNMVLSRHHHVLSDGVVCLTMGHGLTEERLRQLGLMGRAVAVHDYFGDRERVVADLERIGADPELGLDQYVKVDPNGVRRNPQTGYVESLC